MSDDQHGQQGLVIVLSLACVLAFVACAALAFGYVHQRSQTENWKRRWNSDTRELAIELKATSANLIAESAEKVKAQTELELLRNRK